MGSFCLSSASILRCASLTRIQEVVLIIPIAVEVVFATTLIITNWGSGWRHLLLTAEGWIYFALALLDLLSHIIPAARDDLAVFRVIDILLAATSFIPILCFMVFVYLFTRAELIDILPRRFQNISKVTLLIFIPAIIGFNEVASFIGISHRLIPIGNVSILSIGFPSPKDELLWTFFTSLTLALLTAYQAIAFCFAFYRLLKAFIDQRNIENSSTDQNHLFKGIGWVTGGLKLGAIETVIGFAQGGFGGALTRRILRFLSRAFIIIGLAKGLDTVEDFRQVRDEMATSTRKEFRRSKLRQFISNPRFSTFRQLSPTATGFHSTPRAPAGLPGMSEFAGLKQGRNKQRVTVHFDQDSAPTLHMRFSALDLPSPAGLVESIKSRPQSEWASTTRLSSFYAASSLPPPPDITPLPQTYTPMSAPPQIYNTYATHSRGVSSFSARSVPESLSSLHAVRELAAQFPGLPPRVTGKRRETLRTDPSGTGPYQSSTTLATVPEDSKAALSASSSLSKRKPVPSPSPEVTSNSLPSSDSSPATGLAVTSDQVHGTGAGNRKSVVVSHKSLTSSLSNTPLTMISGFSSSSTRKSESDFTPDTENPFMYDESEFPAALHSGKSRELKRGSTGPEPGLRTAEWIGAGFGSSKRLTSERLRQEYIMSGPLEERERDRGSERESDTTLERVKSDDTLHIPWLRNPEMEENEASLARALSRKAHSQPARIKSVGKAPRRYTPNPVNSNFSRGSIYIEPIIIPPKDARMDTEIIQGSVTSNSPYGGGVLRDSEVLGIEDGYVRGRSFFAHD